MSDQPRRRALDHVEDRPATFEELVATAVGHALDRRWQSTRWRVILVALITTLAVSLPITWLNDRVTNQAALARSRHNCALIHDIAAILGSGGPTLPRGGFISTDAQLRRGQQFDASRVARLHAGPLKALLSDPQTRRISRASSQLDSRTTDYWTGVLIPRLLGAAHADCSAAG